MATAPPTLVSYTEVAYNGTGTSRASASVSWQTGDIIGVQTSCENVIGTLGTPTATGLSFTQQLLNTTASTCGAKATSAIAASSGSGAITVTNSDATALWGFGIWVWRGSGGLGQSREQHTTAKTSLLSDTNSHSAYYWSCADFAAAAVADVLTPFPTTTQEVAQEGVGKYSVYSGNLNDMASSGSQAFGIAGATATGALTIIVQEILGLGVLNIYTGVRLRYRVS